MREIKFRAWDGERLRKVNTIGWVDEDMDFVTTPRYSGPAEDFRLMQFTGLKDKNGVEIYEGDVLFHPLQGRRKVFYPYSETVASYGLRDIDNGFGSTLQDSHAIWEVIGNIYENQELLERLR